MVKFALGGGKGIKHGDVVYLNGSESVKPLFLAVRRAIWEAGGHALIHYFPEGEDRYNFSADFFEKAKDHQLDFFPAKYFRGLVDEIDHVLFILGDSDPHALKDSDPKKIMRRGKAMKQFLDWRRQKEHQGKTLLDARALRHAWDGKRGRALYQAVLAGDNPSLLLGRKEPYRKME